MEGGSLSGPFKMSSGDSRKMIVRQVGGCESVSGHSACTTREFDTRPQTEILIGSGLPVYHI